MGEELGKRLLVEFERSLKEGTTESNYCFTAGDMAELLSICRGNDRRTIPILGGVLSASDHFLSPFRNHLAPFWPDLAVSF